MRKPPVVLWGIVVFTALLLLNILLVSAQSAEYNFGTTQQSNVIEVEPGKAATTKIFFYNIWGNRVTHVRLDITQQPEGEGWNVELSPPLSNVTLNVTGIVVTVEENLFAVPCKIDDSWCPTSDPIPREGVEFLSASGVEGKVPAKYAVITVTAPESIPLWQEFPLKISASAEWYGEGGIVALSQARDFSYTIKTVTRQYSEEVLPEKEKSQFMKWIAGNWSYIIISLLLLIVALLIRKTRKIKRR